MNIILSIHPKWANLIYEGKKTIEWRKSIPMKMHPLKLRDGDPKVKVYIYETSPMKLVTGFFYWGGVKFFDARFMTNQTPEVKSGQVPAEDLKKYQGDRCSICGWLINKPMQFKGIIGIEQFGLKRPPQSWCYTERNI